MRSGWHWGVWGRARENDTSACVGWAHNPQLQGQGWSGLLLAPPTSAGSIIALPQGTDILRVCLEALSTHLSKMYAAPVAFSRALSAEKAPSKQQFTARNHESAPRLFGNVLDLVNDAAVDVKSGSSVAVPYCEFFAAGFSCRSRSPLNKHSASLVNCIQQRTGETAETFFGCFDYIVKASLLTNTEGFVWWGFRAAHGWLIRSASCACTGHVATRSALPGPPSLPAWWDSVPPLSLPAGFRERQAKPRAFLLENVRGLEQQESEGPSGSDETDAARIVGLFKDQLYGARWVTVAADDYGSVTRRERLYLFGLRASTADEMSNVMGALSEVPSMLASLRIPPYPFKDFLSSTTLHVPVSEGDSSSKADAESIFKQHGLHYPPTGLPPAFEVACAPCSARQRVVCAFMES